MKVGNITDLPENPGRARRNATKRMTAAKMSPISRTSTVTEVLLESYNVGPPLTRNASGSKQGPVCKKAKMFEDTTELAAVFQSGVSDDQDKYFWKILGQK